MCGRDDHSVNGTSPHLFLPCSCLVETGLVSPRVSRTLDLSLCVLMVPFDFFYPLILEMEVSSRDLIRFRFRFDFLVNTLQRWC